MSLTLRPGPLASWCLIGAVYRVAGFCGDDDCETCNDSTARDDAAALLMAIRPHISDRAMAADLDVWNDTPTTTHAKVLQAVTDTFVAEERRAI